VGSLALVVGVVAVSPPVCGEGASDVLGVPASPSAVSGVGVGLGLDGDSIVVGASAGAGGAAGAVIGEEMAVVCAGCVAIGGDTADIGLDTAGCGAWAPCSADALVRSAASVAGSAGVAVGEGRASAVGGTGAVVSTAVIAGVDGIVGDWIPAGWPVGSAVVSAGVA
jgi:hypothetical protein